ncbi:MAG TPA: hypothetical protein ENI15_04575 [Spirochaetes bacterium]|nr:hypothetical protein [Spirochaetota bacterium]
MADKILCFSLNGFSLAVEPEQIEKILINKHPTKDNFVLETGVEVKNLKSYIPLPDREEALSDNIMFVKDQKDFYGFTVDRISGYLRLKSTERIRSKVEGSPILYFVKNENNFIPVLDLHFITNNENSITNTDIEEIMNFSLGLKDTSEDHDEVFDEVSEDEIYKSIEEEINKTKTTHFADKIIESEKKGIVLPLILNIFIIVGVTLGLVYYMIGNKSKVEEQAIGESVAGVEEEVIREIRRRSEKEVKEQKKKLEDARKRMEELQQEKDFFLENQDEILKQRELELNEEFQRSLEEARKKLSESDVTNFDEEFEKERERLYQEFLSSREDARSEMVDVKANYESELRAKEAEIQNEVDTYSKQLDEIEQKLQEEQAKLKEAEERAQTVTQQQQEYMTFRRQLNMVYKSALGKFSRQDYEKGIEELNTLVPIIEAAKQKRIGDAEGLEVEENLVKNILYLAEREQNRVDLNQIGRETYEAALTFESRGQLEEALSRYFTVYTLGSDSDYKNISMNRAEIIMEKLYKDRSESEREELESNADNLFQRAMLYKSAKEYDGAIRNLEEILTSYPATEKAKTSLDEIIVLNNRKALLEKEEENEKLNRQAQLMMKDAENSFENGQLLEAISKYEEIIRNFKDSDQMGNALAEIVNINKQMKGLQTKPSFARSSGAADSTGVVVQVLPGNTVLFNLGSEEDIKKGDVLQIFRNEESGMEFIGSLQIYSVNPKTSKGRIVYYEKKVKIGDVVSF